MKCWLNVTSFIIGNLLYNKHKEKGIVAEISSLLHVQILPSYLWNPWLSCCPLRFLGMALPCQDPEALPQSPEPPPHSQRASTSRLGGLCWSPPKAGNEPHSCGMAQGPLPLLEHLCNAKATWSATGSVLAPDLQACRMQIKTKKREAEQSNIMLAAALQRNQSYSD